MHISWSGFAFADTETARSNFRICAAALSERKPRAAAIRSGIDFFLKGSGAAIACACHWRIRKR